jgi:diacylglycerol kinase family enzyme
MGSGNGLAHHLKIPMDMTGALQLINRAHSGSIDTATANGHFFVSIAGVGFDAWVAGKFAGRKRRGFWTYLWLILSEFPTYKARQYRLVIDGVFMERKALFVSFANSDQFGYKTRIAPGATVTDGLLDVCIVGKPSVFSIPRLSHLLFINEIGKLRDVEIIKAREISLVYSDKQVFNLDGDPIMMENTIKVKISPLSLNVILP